MSFHDAFKNLDRQADLWSSSGHDLPPETYWGAMGDVFDVLADATAIKPWHHEPAERALRYWCEILPLILNGTVEAPTGKLLELLKYVREAKQEIKAPTAGPLELADLPGMTENQVAAMMGWDMERTRQFYAARKARANGLKYDPQLLERPVMTPEEKGRVQDSANIRRAYQHAVASYQRSREAVQEFADDWKAPAAHESIEALLQMDGMNHEQIAKMHRVPVEEVHAVARRLGQTEPDGEAVSLDKIRDEILAYRDADPEVSTHELAAALGQSIEFVEEVLNGTVST